MWSSPLVGLGQAEFQTPVVHDMSIGPWDDTQIGINGNRRDLVPPGSDVPQTTSHVHNHVPVPLTPIPEPAPLALVAAGFILFGGGILLRKH
jgi:hypothetical protein